MLQPRRYDRTQAIHVKIGRVNMQQTEVRNGRVKQEPHLKYLPLPLTPRMRGTIHAATVLASSAKIFMNLRIAALGDHSSCLPAYINEEHTCSAH